MSSQPTSPILPGAPTSPRFWRGIRVLLVEGYKVSTRCDDRPDLLGARIRDLRTALAASPPQEAAGCEQIDALNVARHWATAAADPAIAHSGLGAILRAEIAMLAYIAFTDVAAIKPIAVAMRGGTLPCTPAT